MRILKILLIFSLLFNLTIPLFAYSVKIKFDDGTIKQYFEVEDYVVEFTTIIIHIKTIHEDRKIYIDKFNIKYMEVIE